MNDIFHSKENIFYTFCKSFELKEIIATHKLVYYSEEGKTKSTIADRAKGLKF